MTDAKREAGALLQARRLRYEQDLKLGWSREDCQAFLDGKRDHWPSVQALVGAKGRNHDRH